MNEAKPNKLFKRPAAAKRPAALMTVAPKDDDNSKKDRKGEPSKNANVIDEIEYPLGWKAFQYKTPKGRAYWKYVRPDGVYFFSLKLAKQSGFAPEAES